MIEKCIIIQQQLPSHTTGRNLCNQTGINANAPARGKQGQLTSAADAGAMSHQHTSALVLVAIRRSTAPASLTPPRRNDRDPRGLQDAHARCKSSPRRVSLSDSTQAGQRRSEAGACLFKDLLNASVVLGRAFCARRRAAQREGVSTSPLRAHFKGERPAAQLTEVKGSSYSPSHSKTLRRGNAKIIGNQRDGASPISHEKAKPRRAKEQRTS